jgi:hypothetical protein
LIASIFRLRDSSMPHCSCSSAGSGLPNQGVSHPCLEHRGATNTSALFGIYRWGWGLRDLAGLQRRHRVDRLLRLLLDPAMMRRWYADPFGFLRPWGAMPALIGSARPTTPLSTGTVLTFLMG